MQIISQLFNQVRLLEALRQARAPRNPHELNIHLQRHEALFHAIEAGDTIAAPRLLREQWQLYGAAVLAALRMGG
jgi:DNA-binding GntR family transcriptional regulator